MDNSDGYEIPQDLRQLAEKKIGQTRESCEQAMGLARQVGEQVARSQGEIAASTLEIQSAAFGFAEQNIASSFEFAARMARAANLGEYFQIQSDCAKLQLETVNRQTQELGVMLVEAAVRTAKAGE